MIPEQSPILLNGKSPATSYGQLIRNTTEALSLTLRNAVRSITRPIFRTKNSVRKACACPISP
ncbi:MAG: RebB family R body protein [Ruminococcus sp.]|nr:RebB family R body protein [Ruminococcus sp.]